MFIGACCWWVGVIIDYMRLPFIGGGLSCLWALVFHLWGIVVIWGWGGSCCPWALFSMCGCRWWAPGHHVVGKLLFMGGSCHCGWWMFVGAGLLFAGGLSDAPHIPAGFRSFLWIPVPFQWNLPAKISLLPQNFDILVISLEQSLESTGMNTKNCQIWEIL